MPNVISIFENSTRVDRQERPVMMDFFISGSTIVAEPWEIVEKIENCFKSVRNRGSGVNYVFFSPDLLKYIPSCVDFTCNVIQLKQLYNEKLNTYRIVASNVNLTEFLSGIEPTFSIEVINT